MAKPSLIDRIRDVFSGRRKPPPPTLAERFLRMLAITDAQELTCDEVFELLDQVAEIRASGQDPAAFMPLVDKHLKVCGDCREEYEALLTMIGLEPLPAT